MKAIHPLALFRLSVLGPLASREHFSRGELKQHFETLAEQTYNIPNSNHVRLSAKTIEAWYYQWKKGGVGALTPKVRCDAGRSKLEPDIQAAILVRKRDNPRRSVDTLIEALEAEHLVSKGQLSRSSVHRLLQREGLSRQTQAVPAIERRSFEASYSNETWYGDVMHGPTLSVDGKRRKVCLVSIMDDASRLMTHSAFCLGEKSVDIEGVLKQAVMRRGLPRKFVVDNGSAYRAGSLQAICARLEIRLVYCRPYEPEGKGKLERWHRVVHQQFVSELQDENIHTLGDLNARLWAWIDSVYHCRAHSSLKRQADGAALEPVQDAQTPLSRYQQDLSRHRMLGALASHLNEIFYHRETRTVRKDATVSYNNKRYEVDFILVGQKVVIVFDPHDRTLRYIESTKDHRCLGPATPIDLTANNHRKRVRTTSENNPVSSESSQSGHQQVAPKDSLVERALAKQSRQLAGLASANQKGPQ